jgi:very-short-patch-repair endonuclease
LTICFAICKANCWADLNLQGCKSSGKKCWFNCDKCPHPFDSPLNGIVRGRWCSYCANQKLCANEECKTCFEKSFASQPKAKYWNYSKNNGMNPRDLFKSSGKKCWFDCDKCSHIFDSRLASITNGNWCSNCRKKTERKLHEALVPLYPSIVREFKQEWCKNITHLPFDFCIPEDKIIIELDGPQHFIQVSNWQSPEETHENDLFKEKCANENEYSVIRLIQEDVLMDKYDWLTNLRQEIENVRGDTTIIHNIYMCKNNEYGIFG